MLVRWLHLTAAVLLLGLWVPATAHCNLESVPGLEFLSCCDHADTAPHEDDDCETDACAIVESGFYKIEDDGAVLPELIAIVLPAVNLQRTVFFTPSQPAPPTISRVWSFVSRLSPPARAPALT